jgi:hypothetical protein
MSIVKYIPLAPACTHPPTHPHIHTHTQMKNLAMAEVEMYNYLYRWAPQTDPEAFPEPLALPLVPLLGYLQTGTSLHISNHTHTLQIRTHISMISAYLHLPPQQHPPTTTFTHPPTHTHTHTLKQAPKWKTLPSHTTGPSALVPPPLLPVQATHGSPSVPRAYLP